MEPFEFEQKTDIGEITSSSSDNEEEGAEAVVWRRSAAGSVEKLSLQISQNPRENTCARVSFSIKLHGASTVQKQSLTDVLRNSFQASKFFKKRLQHWRFPVKFTKFLRTPFPTNISTPVAASGSKQLL